MYEGTNLPIKTGKQAVNVLKSPLIAIFTPT